MKTRLLILLPLLPLLLWATACRQQDVSQTDEGRLLLGDAEVTDTVARSVAPGGRTLVLNGFNGAIRLEGGTQPTAELQFTRRARGRDDGAARSLLEGVEVQEAGDNEVFQYVMRSSDPQRSAVDVTGTVPQGTRLRIELETGSIVLSGVTGPIEVRSDGLRTVRIGGAGATVDVETQNGNLDVGMATLPADAAVRLKTGNGNVTLTLPAATAAQVEASTSVGDIVVEGLEFTNRRLEPEGAGARFRGRLGRGNARVEVATQNGTIALREGTVQRIPLSLPADTATTLPAAPADTAAPATGPAPADTAALPPGTPPAASPADTARIR